MSASLLFCRGPKINKKSPISNTNKEFRQLQICYILEFRLVMSTSNAIHYTLNAVRSTLIENSRNFRFKTLTLKNKNKILQNFLSPF